MLILRKINPRLSLGRVYIGIVNGLVTCTNNLQDSY